MLIQYQTNNLSPKKYPLGHHSKSRVIRVILIWAQTFVAADVYDSRLSWGFASQDIFCSHNDEWWGDELRK